MTKFMARIKDNFNLNGVEQVYFWKSEWEEFDPQDKLCTVSIGYLAYRAFFAFYFIGATAYSLYCSDLNYYFIFLTNLAFTLQLIYSIFYLLRLIWIRIQRREIETRLFKSSPSVFSQEPKLPWPEKLIWILVNVVTVLPYGVSFFYWIFLFDADEWSTNTVCQNAGNILTHALNSVMAFLDSGVMAIPIRISHAIFPVIIALAYCVFAGIYEVAGGTYVGGADYIYSILDFKNNPGWAIVTCLGGIIFAVIGHFVACWGTYRLRILAVDKYFSDECVPNSQEARSSTVAISNAYSYSNPALVEGDEGKDRGTLPSGTKKVEPDPELGYQRH